MNFINSIFLTLAAFFGFGHGTEEVTAEPAPIEREETMLGKEIKPAETVSFDNEAAPAPRDSTVDSVGLTASDLPSSKPAVIGEAKESPAVADLPPNIKTMVVGGGCFWCVEADLEKVPGVISAVSGYAGGTTENPTYQTYAEGGHREVVRVTYNANQVSFEEILIATMKTTDPTDDHGTFGDRGDEYAPAFYYADEYQKTIIDSLIADVNAHGPYDKPLAIDVEPETTFWPAEDYHQDYYKGTFSQLKYQYYRNASGRDDFIKKFWGTNDHSPKLPWRQEQTINTPNNQNYMWSDYQKPSPDILREKLDEMTFKVTQAEGTEPAQSSPLDKIYEPGIYVDVLSGEPLYSSKDKFDSGTGWPSFTKPITSAAVTEHEDKKLFSTRTEIRSAIADNHLGHVFTDGPKDSTGLRYCMNGVALRFIPKDQMESEGYGDFLQYL